jgi:CBS domain-containing protein
VSGGKGVDIGEDGVHGDRERLGIPAGLCEDEPALDGREQGESELVRVGFGAECATVAHGAEAGADGFLPSIERGGEIGARVGVLIGQFGGEGSDWAAANAAALPLYLDLDVAPGVERLKAVKVAEVGLLPVEHCVGLAADHGPREHQFGRGVHDTGPGGHASSDHAAAAAYPMKHARTTALMVLDPQTGQPKGILTEGDIAHAVADGKDLDEVPIRALMTIRPTVTSPATSVRAAAQIMTRGHFRHLPVSGDSGLVGIIDIIDVCRALIDPDVPRRPAA